MYCFNSKTKKYCLSAAFCVAILLYVCPAWSEGSNTPRVLREALASHNRVSHYNDQKRSGFSLSGGWFSGRASGVDPVATNYLSNSAAGAYRVDRTAELEGDSRVFALMIDGKYDFNTNLIDLPIRPYMSGGFGMAMYDSTKLPTASELALQGGGMVPLVRIGGGVNYHVSESMDVSLDYKAGFSGAGDRLFTGRDQQTTNLHVINMGMRLAF
jgi:hypothetical protein